MKIFGMLTALVAIAAAAAPASAVVLAEPSTTSSYSFTGACSDCTGFGTGVLTLQNYTAGTRLSNANFVSFSYTSNLLPAVTISRAEFSSITGGLTEVPGANTLDIRSTNYNFATSKAGAWNLFTNDVSTLDFGPSHSFATVTAAVPEPATWGLMLLGFGLVGAAARRRGTVAAHA